MLALQFTTGSKLVWHRQKRWERQVTANIKVILVILKGCLMQRSWLLLNGFAKESQMKWGLRRNVQLKDPATFLVLKKVDQKHQMPWKKSCVSQGIINLWYHWERKRCWCSKSAGHRSTSQGWDISACQQKGKRVAGGLARRKPQSWSHQVTAQKKQQKNPLDGQAGTCQESFTNTLFPGPWCFHGEGNQQHQQEPLSCAAFQVDAPLAGGYWWRIMTLTTHWIRSG